MSIFKKRGELLSDRLGLIGAYLSENTSGEKGFDVFLAERKISKADFIKGLPDKFKNPPPKKREDIIEYGKCMNDEYYDAYVNHQRIVKLTADGESLECSGGQCADCPCKKSADGDEMYADSYSDGVVTEGDQFFASGNCGLPPIKPLLKRSQRPAKWAEYDAKKAKYEACRAAKKDDRKNDGPKKGRHNLNKHNPLFVIARNAFRLLLSVNVMHLAKNLNKMHQANGPHWKKISGKWYNLGGDVSDLLKSINTGKNKRTPKEVLQGKPKNADGSEMYADGAEMYADGTFSFTGAEITVALGSAAGIIAAVKPIIESFKREKGEPNDETGELPITAPPLDGPITSDDTAPDDAPDGIWDLYKIPIIIGGSVVLALGIVLVVVATSSKAK